MSDKVVLLTYDAPHRKTEDVLCRLLLGLDCELSVLAMPWVERKARRYIYGHRPAEKHWPCEPFGPTTRAICENLDLSYLVCPPGNLAHELSIASPDLVVVGGAGILPREVVSTFRVLNVHPGLLPARRGLDVFKWAIHDCKPVGVTAHICDEHTDLGWRIDERTVPVFPEDSLQSFAMRQYEYELGLFVPAARRVLAGETLERVHPGETKAHRRMPPEIEAGLPEAFERYKRVWA